MITVSLLLALVAAIISTIVTAFVLRISQRLAVVDTQAMPGQQKQAHRAIPNTGGIGIFVAIAVPISIGLAAIWMLDVATLDRIAPALATHAAGIRAKTPLALSFLLALTAMHAIGLIDDRRPLGPIVKLFGMILPPILLATLTDTRLLTVSDQYVGGTWLSITLTVIWFVGITNAMNFIDNMDGLCGGVTVVAGSCLLAAVLVNGQWFVGAVLALVVGASAGFLLHNRPPAKIFMGDAGSLVIGFSLAFLTVRTTYFQDSGPQVEAGPWYAILMPLVVLAIPLYDMTSVTLLRLSQGKSPMVGDLQHFSHRLVDRGLSKGAAVLVICGLTLVTGVAGISLASLEPWQAILVGVQTISIIAVLAVFERASTREEDSEHRA